MSNRGIPRYLRVDLAMFTVGIADSAPAFARQRFHKGNIAAVALEQVERLYDQLAITKGKSLHDSQYIGFLF